MSSYRKNFRNITFTTLNYFFCHSYTYSLEETFEANHTILKFRNKNIPRTVSTY